MVDRNPYAAPQADQLPRETFQALDLLDATQGTRVANFFLDTIFRQIFAMAMFVVASPFDAPTLKVVFTLFAIFGYYAIFEGLTGRTPAKYITRTRVVDMMGGKPSFGQIVGRSAARFIPLEPFSFLGSSQRGWHDSLSRTRVVRA
jgi:uncharacterized RDD family membrane protein YckC